MTECTGSDRLKKCGSIGNYNVEVCVINKKCVCRFVVEGSVEERILQLQQKKIGLANEVMTGAKRSGANKLSFDDLKMLFQVP